MCSLRLEEELAVVTADMSAAGADLGRLQELSPRADALRQQIEELYAEWEELEELMS